MATSPPLKTCARCKERLPLDQFAPLRKAEPDGYRMSYCRPCANERNKEKRAKNPERWKEYERRQRIRLLALTYGLTLDRYREIERRQQHRCAICRRPLAGLRVHVDHCHKTGAVRGLLCHTCNTGIGILGDSWQNAARAMRYLRADRPAFTTADVVLPLPPGGGSGSWHRSKTHCPQGHPYTPENTRIHGVTGARACRTCERNRQYAVWRAKNPDAPRRQRIGEPPVVSECCKRGHVWTEETTRWDRKPSGTLSRKCRECERENAQARRRRKT